MFVLQFICWNLISMWWYLEEGLLGSYWVMRVKSSQMAWVPAKALRNQSSPFQLCEEKVEMVIYESGNRPSPDTNSVTTLILDFPSKLWKINIGCVSHPVYGIFIIAARSKINTFTQSKSVARWLPWSILHSILKYFKKE